jgi:tyrosinase
MAPPLFSHTLHIVLHICLLFRISTPSPVTLNGNGPLRRSDQTRQTGVFSVLGVAGLGDTSVYPRLEVRELERNADQWNIYLLGLKRFQETGKDDRLSYYQIAGTCAICSDQL